MVPCNSCAMAWFECMASLRGAAMYIPGTSLAGLLGPQSHFGGNLLTISLVSPPNGTVVLKGLLFYRTADEHDHSFGGKCKKRFRQWCEDPTFLIFPFSLVRTKCHPSLLPFRLPRRLAVALCFVLCYFPRTSIPANGSVWTTRVFFFSFFFFFLSLFVVLFLMFLLFSLFHIMRMSCACMALYCTSYSAPCFTAWQCTVVVSLWRRGRSLLTT